MRIIQYLSYPLYKTNPVYGCESQILETKPVKSISRGDSCNTLSFFMETHWGTHIDFPAHFFNDGKSVLDYPADFWIFSNPQLIVIPAQPNQIINRADFRDTIVHDTNLLLLYTGWGKYRGEAIYSMNNPGLAPEVGLWLRKEYPNIRVIGFDFISVSPYQNRELGRHTHQAFLDPSGEGNPILIIEDMLLANGNQRFQEVWVAPLRIEGFDGTPCTVAGICQ